ncbi:MAG: PIG-L family deacetylase, partial [Patescibacteria group bacterium]|nr:PIG-L family deacetylase [Patescibacteria group bacterium]
VYEDVATEMTHKIRALKIYKSEIGKFPHPRSIKAIESLAMYRGVESGLIRAEAFELIRNISK